MTCEMIENYELKNHTTFKIGGCAKRAYFPTTIEEFCTLLDTLKSPLILGNCSNVLISTNGVNEDVIMNLHTLLLFSHVETTDKSLIFL